MRTPRDSQYVGHLQKLTYRVLPHSLVIGTLRDANETEPDRKCFRLVGGVLVERTVQDVLPNLEIQLKQVSEYRCYA